MSEQAELVMSSSFCVATSHHAPRKSGSGKRTSTGMPTRAQERDEARTVLDGALEWHAVLAQQGGELRGGEVLGDIVVESSPLRWSRG